MSALKILDALHFRTAAEERFPACVVAVGFEHDGEVVDWAAYGGGYAQDMGKRDGEALVARFGEKLSERRARAIFSEFGNIPYRD